MEYTTLCSTFGDINTIKYQHIGTQSAVVYDFTSTIIELVSILVRFKIEIPQRWYFLYNTIVFSFYTTWYTTEDNMQYVLEIYVGQRQKIIQDK